MIFEWDDHKEKANIRKHGVDFHEASTSFADPLKLEFYDATHSVNEDRFILLGISSKGRLLTVVFLEKRDDLIRIISARTATRSETNFYDQSNKP